MKRRRFIQPFVGRLRLRPSYGLKTLMIGVGVAAVLAAYGTHWHQRRQAAKSERREFDVLNAYFYCPKPHSGT